MELNVTFNRKTGSPDGLQPYCRECDTNQKGETRHGYVNFRRRLIERALGEERLWAESSYEELMGDYTCKYCGSRVADWSAGYWVDRISNERGYKPENCLPCCWPCNREKRDKSPEVFHGYIASLIAKYTRGKIPWDQLGHKYKPTNGPRLDAYVVPPRQGSLFKGTGT